MIKAYFLVFVNFKQNNWVQFFFITKFAYNNTKNTSINHTSFKLNYKYQLCNFYKEDLDFYSKLKITKKLFSKF